MNINIEEEERLVKKWAREEALYKMKREEYAEWLKDNKRSLEEILKDINESIKANERIHKYLKEYKNEFNPDDFF